MHLPPYVKDFARWRDWTRWVQSPWESFWLVQVTSFNCLHEDSSQVSYRRRLLVLYPWSVVKWRESVQRVQGLPAACIRCHIGGKGISNSVLSSNSFFCFSFMEIVHWTFLFVLFWILRQGPVEPRLVSVHWAAKPDSPSSTGVCQPHPLGDTLS